MDVCNVEQKRLWESSTDQASHLSGIRHQNVLSEVIINGVLRDNKRPGN